LVVVTKFVADAVSINFSSVRVLAANFKPAAGAQLKLLRNDFWGIELPQTNLTWEAS
jgi:hypothetical protein